MKKTNPLQLSKILTIFVAILASLLIGSFFILLAGGDPLSTYKELLITPISSWSNIGEVITNLTPLLIVGSGMALALSCGLTNLGGEGQIYMGAMGLIIICNSPLTAVFGRWTLIIGMLAAMILGGLWGGISGAMKSYLNANEIITSLLLNYIAINLIGFAVRGPLQESTGVAPESDKISEILRFPQFIPMSRAHLGILIGLIVLAIYYFVFSKTKVGYSIKILGHNPQAAEYSGISKKKFYLSVMFLSGAVAGLAGSVEVLGVYHKLTEKMAGNIGFTGVVVALLGMLHPIGIFFAALLMAILNTGSQYVQIVSNIPSSLVGVLQGLIVLFVLLGLSFDFSVKKCKKEKS